MATFIAEGVAVVEAEDRIEAWEVADHSELPWEVVGVVDTDVVVAAVVPEARPSRRSWFGWSSLALAPLLAYGAIADTSAIRALAATFGG